MATIQSAVITTDTRIMNRLGETDDGKKYAHVAIHEAGADIHVALLSSDSDALRRLAANVSALADTLDRATS